MRAAGLSSHDLIALAGRFLGARAGDAQVAGGHAEVRYDEDEPYVLLSLALGPPPPGHETWPVDDLFALRQDVRRRLREAGYDDVRVSYVGGFVEGEQNNESPVSPKERRS